ncbi:Gfo/Idh/MocA family oxidoreductase [Pseudohoeflea suaedae]|uniref:Gfo/Idh/MocA family oxidoreductase n=1 Tax=Pseudohoeflea suaedae TaxID=877384 RepID=A0A4R5PJ06_9HYPH|nr:Gfo/Idh/MocA family oxidoreductase [Pseudohoeflea suaedae]TDH35151.1 Gfo/Idh/MocA family oxidoreductase [Pseudohoeflea suaedae]
MTDRAALTPDLKIAVVGCGVWGGNHIRTLAGLGALGAVCDRNPDKANAMVEANGGVALSFEDMLADETIDGVVLALPPHEHAEAALAVIAAGKHLFVEKPIALSVEDARRVVDAAEASRLTAMTGHVLRYHPAFEALADLVAGGQLGEIRYIHSHRLGLGRFHSENDALWDIAPHDLSLIMALTGERPVEVHGEGSAVLNHLSDFAHLHLRFPSGVKSHVFTSRLNPYRERRLTVIGSKAMAVFEDMEPWDRKLAVYHHEVWEDENGFQSKMVDPEYIAIDEGMPLASELRHFLHCIETGETPRTPVADGLAVIEILSQGTVRHD